MMSLKIIPTRSAGFINFDNAGDLIGCCKDSRMAVWGSGSAGTKTGSMIERLYESERLRVSLLFP